METSSYSDYLRTIIMNDNKYIAKLNGIVFPSDNLLRDNLIHFGVIVYHAMEAKHL